MFSFLRKHKTIFSLGFFISVFFILSLGSSIHESQTFDEYVHIQEGINALEHHTFAIDTNNPPLLREIQVIPLLLHIQNLIPNRQTNWQILPGRMITILFGIFLLILIFFTTKKYFGFPQALFAGLLYTFDPTILGNSHYITQDIGLTLIFFAAYMTLVWMKRQFSFKKLFLFAVLLGLGCASKITFIPFFLLSLVIFGLYSKRKNILTTLWVKRNLFIFSFAICTVVIWATYFFTWHVIVSPRQDNTRISAKLTGYATKTHNTFLFALVTFAEKQPVPLGDYLGVLKNITVRSISKSPSCFFLGKFTLCQRYFIFINLFLKLPLPLILFCFVGFYLFIKKHKQYDVYLLIPLLGIPLSALIFSLDPKVRYILPLYPFLILLAAKSWEFWVGNFTRLGIFLLLLIYYIGATVSLYPHFISYANELTHGQKQFLLSDSDMDWGQSLPDVANYISQQKIGIVYLSYFGRDNGDVYGLKSDTPYGSYKNNEICAFHTIKKFPNAKQATIISTTNWYNCGYNQSGQFAKGKIEDIIGQTMLVF